MNICEKLYISLRCI